MTLQEALEEAARNCDAWQGGDIVEFADGSFRAIPSSQFALYWDREDVICRLFRFTNRTQIAKLIGG